MSRTFEDSTGRRWTAWSVVPERADRRRDSGLPLQEDRRERYELRVRLDDRFTNGWIVFETAGERRRLAPIPDNWEAVDQVELIALWTAAEVVSRPRRRLVE